MQAGALLHGAGSTEDLADDLDALELAGVVHAPPHPVGGRQRQVGFLAELLADCRHAVVMGDFNCTPDSVELRSLTERAGLGAPGFSTGTFPSWRPRRHIDHILVSSEIDVQRLYVPDWICSDHLPVALDARLPAGLDLAADQTASQTQATSTELHK